MSAEPIDPVAVREARKRLEAVRPNVITRDQFGNDVSHLTVVERDDLALVLAFLDEGREASAPFAVVVADYKKQTQVESDPDYPMLGRIGWEEDPRPPQVRWRELDRLAAWSEAVSEPEGKNDGR